jgi:MoaA/NifB/PqqE/SkfB family radical SAM enzyme
MISNGMMCANPTFMKKLSDAGLELVHFSVYSCHAQIHDFLTDTPGSWVKLMKSITNALNNGIRVQINTVINHYNETHLDATVQFLVKHFSPIRHFVWNNLDPLMMRKTDTAWSTLPNYDNFAPSLGKAMKFLEDSGRTFRVERVPLCYMQ